MQVNEKISKKFTNLEPLEIEQPSTINSSINPLIGSKYEDEAIKSGVDTLKEYHLRDDRQEYFGNPLTFKESLTGVIRRAKDSSITPTLLQNLEESSFLEFDSVKKALAMTKEEYDNDPAIPEGFKQTAKFNPELNLTRDSILKRADLWKERREAEEIERLASGWQKAGRFVATMAAGIGTDLIPNIATGLYSATTRSLTKAFLYAGTENLMFDEVVDFFNADKLIDEGELPKTIAQRNEERAAAFLLGGGLGVAFKAIGNIIDRSRAKNQDPGITLNEIQQNINELKSETGAYRTERFSDMQGSDKVQDLNSAMSLGKATTSLDTNWAQQLESIQTKLKSYEALDVNRKDILPTAFKIPEVEGIVNVDYKVFDIENVILLNERSEGYSSFRGKGTLENPKKGVIKMAKNIDADRLLFGKDFDNGAPLLDTEGRMVLGNNRTIALYHAYKNNLGADYLETLRKSFPQHSLEGIKYPILIKQLTNPINSQRFGEIRSKKGTFVRGERASQILESNAKLIRDAVSREDLSAITQLNPAQRLDALTYLAFRNESLVNATSDLGIALRDIAQSTIDIAKNKPIFDISVNLSQAFDIINLTTENPSLLLKILDEEDISPLTDKLIRSFFKDDALTKPASTTQIKEALQDYYRQVNQGRKKTPEEILNVETRQRPDILPNDPVPENIDINNLSPEYKREYQTLLDREKSWNEALLDFYKCKNS